jgi:hypothetical protein
MLVVRISTIGRSEFVQFLDHRVCGGTCAGPSLDETC